MTIYTRKPFTRRDFLKTTAGSLGVAAIAAGCASGDDASADASMAETPVSNVPVGVQMFCFRHLLEEDFEGTLAQIATLGYDGVEFAGYYGYSAADLRKLLDGHGLIACGAHVGIDMLLGDELQRSIDFHGELGNTRLIVPAIGDDRRAPMDAVMRTADDLTVIQQALRVHGMSTGYHCHAYSFDAPVEGQTIWDLLAQNTPEDVIMQLDTGNAANGGADVSSIIRSTAGRIHSMHVKPFTHGAEHPFAPFIGDDSLPWAEIFALSESEGGIEWYVVEYEDESRPPLEALKTNRDRVRALGRVGMHAG